jgi:bis(5'-nucleosyl)-tetraphosphatase (symmetrical)
MLSLGSWRRSASTVARGFAYCASMALISALQQQHPDSQCDGRPAAREMSLGTTHKVRLLHSRHDSRHATLQLVASCDDDDPQRQRPDDRILIIGDVHGCYDEMIRLYEAAGAPEIVILVGDLVNKGPYSAQVVRHVRTTPGWFAVRGNHDDGALRVATLDSGGPAELGAAAAAAKARQKYAWLYLDEDANENIGSPPARRCALSNDDLQWLADLPYTIRIPAATAATATADQEGHDVVVVHAGLVPGIPLEEQTNRTMVTLRTVVLVANEGQPPSYQYDESSGGGDGVPWASVWTGPDFIIFGHDARRGLQRERHAIGLDTGACYGKSLTGILLPSKKIYQVDSSQTYCPIGSED